MSKFNPIEAQASIDKMKAEIAKLEKAIKDYKPRAPKELPYTAEELAVRIYDGSLYEPLVPGDYITTELYTGETIRIYCTGVSHDTLVSGGKADYSFGVMFVDMSLDMNENNTNETSWKDSKMRTVHIPRLMRLLPKGLTEHIVPVVKKTSAGGRSSKIITTEDKLFMFSEVEVYGKNDLSFEGEGEQYELFKSAEYRKLLKNYPWLRSPYYSDSNFFCYVCYGGHGSRFNANDSIGVAFGFCLSSKIK